MVSAFEVSRTTDFLQDLVRLRRMALSSFNDRGLMMRWDPWGSNVGKSCDSSRIGISADRDRQHTLIV